MSHRPQRKEKDCLNCGTMVQGKFCHICGQENVVPKETFLGMVTHFFYDITHFDSNFFVTLKDLLFKPGFLSTEYMKGRRVSYLNPVRMYIFTSAIFFLVFFSISDPKEVFKGPEVNEPLSRQTRDSIIQRIEEEIRDDPDKDNLTGQLKLLKDTTREVTYLDLVPFKDNITIVGTVGGKYKSAGQYDSIQKALPPEKRDGWLKRQWNKKAIHLNEKYKYDRELSMRKLIDALLHRLPYLLFVSLPFFALILKLLYIRRKEFYYADHGIFAIHHYILSFILLLLIFLWNKMDQITGWSIWDILIVVTVIAWPVYLYIAMRRFYRQGRLKTFIKFILLNISGFIILLLLLVFFFLFSIFQL